MGKNVLKLAGVCLERPSILLRLLAIVALFARVGLAYAEDARMKMLKEHNLSRIPHSSKWNISQAEYERKHGEYFDLVERNRRRRLNSSANHDGEVIVTKKLYTFTHSGLKNSPFDASGIKTFTYDVRVPEEKGKRVEVDETSLRFLMVPGRCPVPDRKSVTVGVSTTTGENVAKEQVLEVLDDCLPRWTGLYLMDGFDLNLNGASLNLSFVCEECVRQDLDVLDPYLNVIVNVRPRLRRRRAEKKKRRRFPGKCVRHPWEVDLGKLKGYEYVIQPRKFDAGLCAGKCTGQWNLATQHSNLQYLFSNIDKTVPKPCCAPSKMESLEILYPDEDNPKKLKVSVWNDTRILECACS